MTSQTPHFQFSTQSKNNKDEISNWYPTTYETNAELYCDRLVIKSYYYELKKFVMRFEFMLLVLHAVFFKSP